MAGQLGRRLCVGLLVSVLAGSVTWGTAAYGDASSGVSTDPDRSTSPAAPDQSTAARKDRPTTPAVARSIVESALHLPQARVVDGDQLAQVVEQDLPEVATGPMRAQLEAELIEMESHGWTRRGTPELSTVQILEDRTAASEPTLTVSACVDWSAVTYHAMDGTALPANPTPRATQIFTLIPDAEGRWVVNAHDVAPSPRC